MPAFLVLYELLGHVVGLPNPGFLILLLVMFVAAWAGTRAGLIACAWVVGYVYFIYLSPYSFLPHDAAKFHQSLISTAILYPLFGLGAGLVQNRLRDSATREFDAREEARRSADQKRAVEAELDYSEEMQRLVVNSSIDAVIAMSEDGLVTLWNPNAEQMFGWTATEAIGQPLQELIIPPSLRSAHGTGLAHFLETGDGPILGRRVELTAQNRAGEEFAIELSTARHQTTNGVLFVGFVRDIGERKRAELAIRELNASLERRVTERTADLEAANAELVGFTYSISHDLRSPLRAIVGHSRILLEEATDHLSPAIVERLQRLETAALKMSQLIEDLLRFARIGQVALNVKEIDLSDMAAGIVAGLRAHGPGEAQIQPGMTATGDPELIALVLQNLFDNAWKYVKHGELPRVEMTQDRNGIVSIKDHGIGFDMAYVEKIWEPFERLHRDSEFPGTGIGLANSMRIITRHGGRLWVQSEADLGSTFYFELPKTAPRLAGERAPLHELPLTPQSL